MSTEKTFEFGDQKQVQTDYYEKCIKEDPKNSTCRYTAEQVGRKFANRKLTAMEIEKETWGLVPKLVFPPTVQVKVWSDITWMVKDIVGASSSS